MTTRDQLDRASKRHPTGEFGIFAAARDEIDQLQAQNAVLSGALEPFSQMAGELFADNWNNSDHVFVLDRDNGFILRAEHFFDARAALNKAGPVVLVTSDVVKTMAKEAREKALEDAAIRAESHGFERGKPMRKTYARASAEAGKMIAASIRAMKEHTDE